jgi:V8-like Glu-specific endopeptidase
MTILSLRRAMVIAATVAAGSALALPAQAAEPTPALITTVDPADQAAALAYWTPERMRQVGTETNNIAETVARPWPTPAPRGVGRLFFTTVPGQDTWCTATAVPSGNKDTAITAGHCLWPGYTRDDQVIKTTNVGFVPGYDHGDAPAGVYAARSFLVPESYTPNSNPDVGLAVFAPSEGRHLTDAVGTQNVSFSETGPRQTSIVGYPGSKAAYGEALAWCDVAATPAAAERWTAPCDMAGGSSGGPWLTGFDPATGTGTIYSVTSKGTLVVDEPTGDLRTTDLAGSTLTDDARSVYEQAAGL